MKTVGGNYKNNKINVGKRTSYNNRQYSRGMELYTSKRFKEAIPYLEAEIIEHKEDERTIFILGKC